MTFGSLFAGIGGFDLGLERAGMICKWQVEIDPYCRAVLAKHWPEVYRHDDIRTFGRAEPVDLICGGFPCQPFSLAGKRRGAADDRHLWPEMLRVIASLRPTWVLGENVAGFVNMGLDQAIYDLEAEGYAVQTFDIPAVAVDAPHQRHRIWIVAHAEQQRGRSGTTRREDATDARQSPGRETGGFRWDAEPNVGRVAHGVPARVDRLRCLGNAVVPQVVEAIGRAILAAELSR